ncbi:MAG: pyrophosphatase [Bdellovibrionales bacterium]|nr:pyrophosphatase [Bdellovibrionales bacterium]
MNLKEIEEKLKQVSDIYAEKFNIKRDDDWFVLKIQEELGELSSAHLKITERARVGNQSKPELDKNLKDEIADVIAMTILFAHHKGIDVESAIKDKWFKYL